MIADLVVDAADMLCLIHDEVAVCLTCGELYHHAAERTACDYCPGACLPIWDAANRGHVKVTAPDVFWSSGSSVAN